MDLNGASEWFLCSRGRRAGEKGEMRRRWRGSRWKAELWGNLGHFSRLKSLGTYFCFSNRIKGYFGGKRSFWRPKSAVLTHRRTGTGGCRPSGAARPNCAACCGRLRPAGLSRFCSGGLCKVVFACLKSPKTGDFRAFYLQNIFFFNSESFILVKNQRKRKYPDKIEEKDAAFNSAAREIKIKRN